ncbi:TrkA family potassium uptake protein [Desulforhopalus sp. IMCC35007]|uniref:potassium channel family protein n=1 Tax=Desulforhopalus sp. IMCC35007 TaxID=2569543 RepID=UPI0010ADC6EC|nr:NAD-binding protein [Desulforhopalus sp. IMCC35007]TKB12106.1 potassium channel protein [Desulforhopalus sp. IMCC35007]
MKFLPSQLLFFFQNKTTRKNLVLLVKFLGFILLIISLYSVLFHVLMLYEGRDFSWITGLYWTLTVMSTLGFGDITFHTDLGLIFTLAVLASGIVLLLIMLPFTFIQFFYAPWLEAQSKIRTPRELPKETAGHVIITNLDPITEKLVAKLKRRNFDYVLVVDELQRAAELYDAGYKVVVGEPDDPETYERLRVRNAALVVATNDDLVNTSVAFTVREITGRVPIVTSANNEHSIDILEFPGNTHVFQFAKMLGRELGNRTVGLGRPVNIVSRFEKLNIAEISATQTTLSGKSLLDLNMRAKTGATVVGLWEKGRFEVPTAATVISARTLLLLAGTENQLDRFEQQYALSDSSLTSDAPVLILGGGRVGLAAAEVLADNGISYGIVEKRANLTTGKEINFIQGDAADINILEKAGVMEARTVIITTHNDAMNIYLAFYCRQLRPDVQIISRATNQRSVSKLHMGGADLVMSFASLGANSIINLLKTDEISMFTEGLNIFSSTMPKVLVGKNLVKSNIREATGCSVVALKSQEGLVVGPDPTIPLRKEDEIILIGATESEQKFLELY